MAASLAQKVTGLTLDTQTEVVDKQGSLLKQGNYIRNWRPRWFKLKDGILYYYKEPEEEATNFFVMAGAKIQPFEKLGINTFEIIMANGDRRYMQANSKKERDEWIAILNTSAERKQRLVNNTPPASVPLSPTTTTTTSASIVSPKDVAAPSATPKSPIKKDDEPVGEVHLQHLSVTKKKKISPEDFIFLKVLGKGNYGKVMLAHLKDQNEKLYAVKVIKKSGLVDEESLDHVLAENRVLQTLDHPFLVKLYYSFQTEERLYFVMEYVNGGELFFHIGREKRFPENRARLYAAEILLALSYLHQKGIVYRDLKLENLLLDSTGHIKITDFGLCKEGIGFNDTTSTFCGTPEYLAPEILEEENYGKSVDWWALGVVLYEMLVGRPPFGPANNMEKLFYNILHQPIYYPSSLSTPARSLLEGLLIRDYTKRLGCKPADGEEIMQHAFFAGVDWRRLFHREYDAPFKPKIAGDGDVSNFDREFTALPVESPPTGDNALKAATGAEQGGAANGAEGANGAAAIAERALRLKDFTFIAESKLTAEDKD